MRRGKPTLGVRGIFQQNDRTSVAIETLNDAPTRRTPRAADLGLNSLAWRLLTLTGLLGGMCLIGYPIAGLSLVFAGAWSLAIQIAIALLVWVYYYLQPGRQRKDWLMAETAFAFLLVMLLALVLTPSQYLAAAVARPTIDPLLATADRWMGVHVPALVEWTRAHPTIDAVLIRSYFTLVAQFTVIFAVLGVILRDRDALWEYTFNFHVCAIVTTVASALLPVAGVFAYYDFAPTIDQTRFIAHFEGIRSGAMQVVHFDDMEGMVSMPSFHTVGGLIVTWALRRSRWLLVPVGFVNFALIAATILTGAHYAIDVVAAVILTVGSIAAYRRWGAPLVSENVRQESWPEKKAMDDPIGAGPVWAAKKRPALSPVNLVLQKGANDA